MNVIELQGRIVNIFNGYAVTIVTLFVKDETGKGYNNYPQITFTKNERDMVHDFEVGNYVNIHATMKTQMDTTEEKVKHKQFIRGLWIGKIKNKISEVFNEDLKGWYEYKNEVFVKGNVLSVKQYGKSTCTILVRPESENFNIMLIQYTKDPVNLIKNYKGKTIYALGSIHTSKKETSGKPAYYQNIVVREADVI